MMNQLERECPNCGNSRDGGIILHELFCYDVYIVSALCPQNSKQRRIDSQIGEDIVKPLEERGYNCFHGSRNIAAGEFILQAMSYPITIIPLTIVPLFKDKDFSSYCNLLLRPDYLKRIMFLTFDSTRIDCPAVSKITVTISFKDEYLLPKLIETIKNKRREFPLEQRKITFELGQEHDPESTSSAGSDFHRLVEFRRSDRSRISFRPKPVGICSEENIVFLEDIKRLTAPKEILHYCHHKNEKISIFSAKVLTRLIKKDIITFYKKQDLQIFEKEVRFLIGGEYKKKYEMNNEFEKLYFWILAAAYLKIYQHNCTELKTHFKHVELKKLKSSKKPYDHLCQKTYHKLTVSVIERIKHWSTPLDHNKMYPRNLEKCLSFLDHETSSSEKDHAVKTMKSFLPNLPWDVKHIFVAIITEKIFQKKFEESAMYFFTQICDLVGKKHGEIFLPVVECATEYIQKNWTKGTLDTSLKLFEMVLKMLDNKKNKPYKLTIIFDHFFQKLLYHPVCDVRTFVATFLFREYLNEFGLRQLGSACIRVSDELVEKCIREKLSNSYPDLIIKEKVDKGSNALVFVAETSGGSESLLYMPQQKTLNDILQTNSTDEAYESFYDMSRAVKICQGHDNIIKLQNIPSCSALPFYVVEHGIPLLQFLHEKENKLAWSQMIDLLIDITNAINHCHNQSIILRNITPASFEVVPRLNGSFQTKLSNFQYAKCTLTEETDNNAVEYIEDINILSFQGDEHEPVPAYFSAPETLQNRTFSKCTEAWMVVATFYSVLLYGRQPFQELAHLKVSDFVKEIISYHSAENPGLFDQDLWEIVSCNFEYEPSKRKLVDQLLKDLEAFKVNLGVKNNFIYSVKSICSYINPEDIQKGYVDNEGNFIFENHEDLPPEIYEDYCETRESDCSYQTVQVKMNLNTRKKLKRLNQANIMRVQEILNGPYKTILVSNLDNYRQTLEELHTDLDRITLLLYLRQLTIALEELHSKNIVHCDLRSRHVYINQEQNTLKLGYLGRAVSLKGNHIIKMMPSEAKKWSAPEVQANGMYSRASDIFALAIVFWEVLSTNKYIRQLRLLKPFQKCESHMDIDFTFPRSPCTQDHIYKLVECMVECWNPNPIKRPKLSNIKQVIDELSNGYMTSRTEIIHEPSDDDDDDDADDEEQYQYQCSDDDDAMVGVAEEEESEDSESEFPIYAKFIS
ncbi:insulin-like growth factor 1 receptor [Pelobates cultripes]|uniref:Insulin-like growth factor 1 receptor n=1 Tax=Pelobates cultripes TaxID=61616 RepID=A0AAD1TCG5_PELCU|nr:insulin-like growth factor 1 receptor [Pelobates cultripes]